MFTLCKNYCSVAIKALGVTEGAVAYHKPHNCYEAHFLVSKLKVLLPKGFLLHTFRRKET